MKCKFFHAVIATVLSLSFFSCKEKPKQDTTAAIEIKGTETYRDSSSSFVRVFTDEGRVCVQKTNTYYELVDVYEGKNKIPLLLKIKKTELCFADSTNKDKVYEIEAKSVLDSKAVEWNAKVLATELYFKDNTALAVHEGVDIQEDFLTRFSLLSGKEIFSCSYADLKVAIPNVKQKRFVGFTSRNAVDNPLKAYNEENLIGIVRYSDGTTSKEGIRIKLVRSNVANKIPSYTPEITFVAANSNTTVMEDGKMIGLMKADENYRTEDVSGFSVQFTFYYGEDNEATIISVPVVNDRLDISHASYDKEIFAISSF